MSELFIYTGNRRAALDELVKASEDAGGYDL
jgi:hypothetical protein